MGEIANADMAAAWDGPEGEHWAAHADAYERTGRRLWRRFTDAVPVRTDDHVLDVGCGTGSSTRDLARTASAGEALGVDLSSAMLERAREAAARDGLTNVRFERADAQVHPFERGAFDLAVSTHGVMFFADPVAAFANIRRALRPGARLAFTSWRPLRENEWLLAIRDALAAGRALPEPPTGAPGPFGLADADDVRRILADAGFTNVTLDAVDEPMDLGAGVAEAYAFVGTFGITRGLTHDLDSETRDKALDTLRQVLADHATPDGVLLGSAAWLVTAVNAVNA